ncbi:membrane-bound lytic murein transglycosylase C [Tepiditoga spiralis]|uniref:Membrane-bound lytic murein transglycosylase C n=1 Tax=Tepiditoga spiralis TaxID=2108365 RepID=A0A7G1G6K6_9BACT|nr:transglycosylase SLT domain-containing protein [Tepiditoga spiralis]BBE32081.1 membrane-bound lytic murein transglycosylase C [Tepiditoga spiralis]
MKKYLIFIFLITFIFNFSEISQWERQIEQTEKLWKDQQDKTNKEWDKYYQLVQSKWNENKRKIEAIWGKIEDYTAKKWIEYSYDKKTYSVVNFDEQNGGYIEIKTILNKNDSINKAKSNIKTQYNKISSERDKSTGQPILKDIAPKSISVDKVEVENKGDKKVYKVKVPLEKNFILKKAKEYIPIIKKYAKEAKIPAELVMAIVHTESSFNPKAYSKIGAYGMMQLMPKYGAADGYYYYYGKRKFVRIDDLYKAELNIKYGAGYLNILTNQYMKVVTDNTKRHYLAIASYNHGPTNVLNLMKKYNVNKMSVKDVYNLIKTKTHPETANYIDRILSREKEYKKYF